MANKTVILTGSTGAFGRFLAFEFSKYQDIKLILLVRALSQKEAETRMEGVIDTKSGAVEVLPANLEKKYLGLSKREYASLCKQTTHILHSAASTRFNLSLEESRLHNVEITKKVMDLANDSPNLIRFGFLSTALVAGKRTGMIKEDEFEHNEGFTNAYQQTKYEAEMLVRKNRKRLPVAIFRPPLIYTPSPSSQREKIKDLTSFLYVLILLVSQGRLPVVPGTKKSTLDIVDAKEAAAVVVALMVKDRLSHLTYHITNGAENATVDALHSMIEKRVEKKIPIEYCGDMKSFEERIQEISHLAPEIEAAYRRTASFLSEPAYPKTFDNSNTLSELGINRIGTDPSEIISRAVDDVLWNC
jgi:thioester reductase-like protein